MTSPSYLFQMLSTTEVRLIVKFQFLQHSRKTVFILRLMTKQDVI